MWYLRAIAKRRDFFRTQALSGTAIAAETIEAPTAARAQGTAVKLGALHAMSGVLSYCGQQGHSTRPRTAEGRVSIAVALLIAGVVVAPALFSPRDALSAEYIL